MSVAESPPKLFWVGLVVWPLDPCITATRAVAGRDGSTLLGSHAAIARSASVATLAGQAVLFRRESRRPPSLVDADAFHGGAAGPDRKVLVLAWHWEHCEHKVRHAPTASARRDERPGQPKLPCVPRLQSPASPSCVAPQEPRAARERQAAKGETLTPTSAIADLRASASAIDADRCQDGAPQNKTNRQKAEPAAREKSQVWVK
eukprot:scaffold28338_cov63-Phaeocystis_antarctica.AAC.2